MTVQSFKLLFMTSDECCTLIADRTQPTEKKEKMPRVRFVLSQQMRELLLQFMDT